MYTTKIFTSQLNNTLLLLRVQVLVELWLLLLLLKIHRVSFRSLLLLRFKPINSPSLGRPRSGWDPALTTFNQELFHVHRLLQVCYRCNNNIFRSPTAMNYTIELPDTTCLVQVHNETTTTKIINP